MLVQIWYTAPSDPEIEDVKPLSSQVGRDIQSKDRSSQGQISSFAYREKALRWAPPPTQSRPPPLQSFPFLSFPFVSSTSFLSPTIDHHYLNACWCAEASTRTECCTNAKPRSSSGPLEQIQHCLHLGASRGFITLF